MLDLPRLRRIRLQRRPPWQRLIANALLWPNYAFLPGIRIHFENADRLPDEPVAFAMNHTDRFNYFPFQYQLYRSTDRFTATWVKGKYYENFASGMFMEHNNSLPTVSRGYLIVRDFLGAVGRRPSDDEYRGLRGWVDREFAGAAPEAIDAPTALLDTPRSMFGRPYDPARETWAACIVAVYAEMMREFMRLHVRAFELGLDLLVFPEGTRSVRLGAGRTGLAQVVLKHPRPIVPISCNGSHRVYPGDNPFARRGEIVYRFGEPITTAELATFAPPQAYEPFTAAAETEHRACFERLTARIMAGIAAGLDDEHRPLAEAAPEVEGSQRFV